MSATGAMSTDPELLRRVAALLDNPAWAEFFERYAEFVRDRCSFYGLDAASVDDLCQRVWLELARRMPSYQYDPGGSFRGWLRKLCHHRAIDLIRERREVKFEAIEGFEVLDFRHAAEIAAEELDSDEVHPDRLLMLLGAREAQEAVKRKVKPARWEAFWRVVIENQSIGAAAADMRLKYATVYAGVNHVAKLLREEGRRRRPGGDHDL
jgi:RNA polymerase sigma factor (sigma-70 family)